MNSLIDLWHMWSKEKSVQVFVAGCMAVTQKERRNINANVAFTENYEL